ncbi:Hpt domain-containing protein [Pseudarthrobacter cellobiosi]|uniref:Hpt domain-containing protein n=1 Tax=Pseudarthrobacter cellobiosi TaxID=2953654 RepID=UPI00208FDE5F|nr:MULTISPECIES: Hpt domain-containing protein [unclassified Pseudarthrobacter]MCO4256693.1 Hpt domain-containing protein [Pseudarthrobacter sp. HLT1-5]MCO4275031.1 Hpt domain-containing protein [Pseudarthrobacter sp. HLT3-5]
MTSTEPVLDRTRLEALAEELDSRATALQFITQFLQMLPARVARIKHALADNDPEAALTAVRSLASSASMVGAHQIARHCRSIGCEFNAVNLAGARHTSLTLDSHTAALTQEITKLLGHTGTDQPDTWSRNTDLPGTGLRKSPDPAHR